MSFDPTTDEIADRYADARARVLRLLVDVSDRDLAAPVPATPDWTGRELLAHMVGCPADLVAGRFEDAGGRDWTQRQVDDRAGHTVAQLLEEWATIAPAVDAGVRAGSVPLPVSLDLLSH